MILTVGLTFLGYLATYVNGLRLTQRQARLDRVNAQLNDFYGPLFALMESNSRVYDTFSVMYAREDGRDPFDTAARWAQGDFTEHLSVVTFPGRGLREYARDRFTQLKGEQARLLGSSGRRPRRAR
ncbi:hypothetical protein ACFXDH_07110 [Streptomyces sp. NPDC059467]|uniref:hypothetical protein n=1 Tax=Streptomyces sp. NPDC059467 TaxID=3346844 RepID=UPI0036C165A4